MNLNRKNIRKIRGLILFTGLVILGLMKFDLLYGVLVFVVGILRPFLVGGMIAFVINLPMSFFEKKLFKNGQLSGKAGRVLNKCSRGISLLLAYLSVILAITLVVVTVIPQLVSTIRDLANEIPIFWNNVITELEVIFAANPELLQILSEAEDIQIDWQGLITTVVNFLRNGMGSMLNSTFSVAGSIINSTVNFFISLIFSIYILVQKEKLEISLPEY